MRGLPCLLLIALTVVPSALTRAQDVTDAAIEPAHTPDSDAGVAQLSTDSDDATSVPSPAPIDAPAEPADASPPEAAPAPNADADADELDADDSDSELANEAGSITTIRYFLERIRVRGNNATSAAVIKRYVPLDIGDVLDIDDPTIETIRFRLMGTGWFNDVRLSLERGRKRGWIVLVVEVRERNTIVVQKIVGGVSRVVGSRQASSRDSIEPYAGLGIAETNLFGLGSTLAAQAVVATSQYGLDLRYHDPMLLGHGYELNTRAFHNRALEFFGKENANKVSIGCVLTPEQIADGEECPPPVLAKAAVVIYRRTGLSLGTGHDISSTLRYTLDWQGEIVDVLHKPDAASRERGSAVVPIDFRVDDGQSVVSSLQLGLTYDRRDDPGVTRRGQFMQFRAIAASGLLGSSYDFTRIELSARHWEPLAWGHTLSVGVFAGSVFGRAPFFYHFYASDLSDLIPSRVLDLNLDHRSPHNLLGTAIGEMRAEELAARIDVEYALPLSSGGQVVRMVDAYLRGGVYALANREDVRLAIPGYDGASRVPVDLTFDLGVRADTSVGVFSFGISTLVGFLPYL